MLTIHTRSFLETGSIDFLDFLKFFFLLCCNCAFLLEVSSTVGAERERERENWKMMMIMKKFLIKILKWRRATVCALAKFLISSMLITSTLAGRRRRDASCRSDKCARTFNFNSYSFARLNSELFLVFSSKTNYRLTAHCSQSSIESTSTNNRREEKTCREFVSLFSTEWERAGH